MKISQGKVNDTNSKFEFLKNVRFFQLATGGRRAPSGGMLLASRVVGGRWPERGKGFIGGVLRYTEN